MSFSEKLVSISENLPEDQKQEYEELLLATTSKCKSTLAQLKSGQEKVAQVAAVFALTEKLTSQIDLCEQIESENTNPVHYFFNDESELALTQEQAYGIVDKWNQLSEDNQEKMVDMLPDSKEVLELFMTI